MTDDLISRQAALDALEWKWAGKAAMNAIKNLPSAQPERKNGKWIQNDSGTYSCSLCQSWIPEEQHFYARYCLYCGAKMEEDDG